LDGYQRQADYTRKTQAVAARERELAQAAALQQALQRDPVQTLKVLEAIYQDQMVAQPSVDPDEDLFADPATSALRQEIRALQQQLAPLQQERAFASAQREVDMLAQTYGSLFTDNQDAVIQAAIDMGTDLDTAFRLVAFDLVFSAKLGEADHNAETAAQQAERLAQKQALVEAMSDSSSASTANVGASPRKTTSLRDAILESARELNMNLYG
jgi:hypothetical protein